MWIKERVSSFNKAAGLRRYVIVGMLSSAISFSDRIAHWFKGDSMRGLIGIPSWVIGIIVVLLFFLYWTIERLVLLDRQIQGSRLEIAKLRTEGVKIRNDGRSLANDEAWRQWEKRANEWSDRVYEKIKLVSEADAEIFNVLDIFPSEARTHHFPFNEEHTILFCEHDCRLERLGNMVYSLWRVMP
jgi:hypothetical protein